MPSGTNSLHRDTTVQNNGSPPSRNGITGNGFLGTTLSPEDLESEVYGKQKLDRKIPLFYLRIRGILVTALAIYWAAAPARNEADIVAATLSYSICIFLALAALITMYKGIRSKKFAKCTLSVYPPADIGDQGDGFSGENTRASLRLNLSQVLPCFQYELTLDFGTDKTKRETHILRGSTENTLQIHQDCVFPHRGIWKAKTIKVLFGDRFGFTAFVFQIALNKELRIAPRVVALHSPEVVTASKASGEEQHAQYERKGDYLDLKPYHPSDGTRRILWKIFARSGELLTRHPEQTYTPEGEVLLYVAASRFDDILCGMLLSYLKYLEDYDLKFRMRTEGHSPTSTEAHNLRDANNLFIESSWNADHYDLEHTCKEVEPLLSDSPVTLYVALSAERLELVQFRTLIVRLGNYIVKNGTEPAFLIYNDATALSRRSQGGASSSHEHSIALFQKECAGRAWECKVIR